MQFTSLDAQLSTSDMTTDTTMREPLTDKTVQHSKVAFVAKLVISAALFIALCKLAQSCFEMEVAPLGPPVNVTNATVAYFGCGCFWHVQHEFVTAVEEQLLGRTGASLTSFAGYAGSTQVGSGGRVCYHNFMGIADYGDMGYAEVVSLSMPSRIEAQVFDKFLNDVCPGGVRQDRQDVGAEYRTLVGFPGGIDSRAGQAFQKAAQTRGIKVQAGSGRDPDALGTVFVMDSSRFPFHQAEVYHQFHDDMVEAYGSKYNDLQGEVVDAGIIGHTGCPSD